jgi:hypothetical protein
VIIPAQGSHLDATEAVKAIKLVKGQERAFKRFLLPSSLRAQALPSVPALYKALRWNSRRIRFRCLVPRFTNVRRTEPYLRSAVR